MRSCDCRDLLTKMLQAMKPSLPIVIDEAPKQGLLLGLSRSVKRLLLNFWETLELLEFAIVFGDHSMLTAGKYLYILLCLVMHLPFACGLCPLSSSSPMPTLFRIVS